MQQSLSEVLNPKELLRKRQEPVLSPNFQSPKTAQIIVDTIFTNTPMLDSSERSLLAAAAAAPFLHRADLEADAVKLLRDIQSCNIYRDVSDFLAQGIPAGFKIAAAFLKCGHMDEGVALAENLLTKIPKKNGWPSLISNYAKFLIEKAVIHGSAEQFREMEREFDKALETRYENGFDLLGRQLHVVQELSKVGFFNKALQIAEKMDFEYHKAQAYGIICAGLIYKGEQEQALRILASAPVTYYHEVLLYHMMAASADMGDIKDALTFMNSAEPIEKDALNSSKFQNYSYERLAAAYIKAGNLEKGKEVIEKLYSEDTENFRERDMYYAGALLENRRFAEALNVTEKSQAISYLRSELCRELAISALDDRNYGIALSAYNLINLIGEDDATFHDKKFGYLSLHGAYDLARVLAYGGLPDQAIAARSLMEDNNCANGQLGGEITVYLARGLEARNNSKNEAKKKVEVTIPSFSYTTFS